MGEIVMQSTDAWLLAATISAGGLTEKGAILTDIISHGDGLNHAIFSDDELASGFYRLTVEGYVVVRRNRFFATEKTKSIWDEAGEKKKTFFKKWDFLKKKMNVAPYCYETPNPANIYKFPGIDKKSVQKATNKWHQTARGWILDRKLKKRP
jgi:hypothetical protein